MVFVSINYRLNAFGFMALKVLSEKSQTKTSGNYGFMDQIQALKWVKQNIVNFGGDPNQVLRILSFHSKFLSSSNNKIFSDYSSIEFDSLFGDICTFCEIFLV